MEGMLKAYDKLRSMPDYFEWAYEKAGILKVTPESFEGSELQKLMSEDCLDAFKKVLGALNELQTIFEDAGLSEIYEGKLRPQAEAALDIITRLRTSGFDDSVLSAIEAFPKATISVRAPDKKELYEPIKPEVKRIREKIIKPEIDGFKTDISLRISQRDSTR